MLNLWYQNALLFWYRFFNLFTGNIRARIRMKNEELSASPIKFLNRSEAKTILNFTLAFPSAAELRFLILHSYYFLTNCHLRAVEYHDNLMQCGGLDGGLHRFRFGIAVHLFHGLAAQLLYP